MIGNGQSQAEGPTNKLRQNVRILVSPIKQPVITGTNLRREGSGDAESFYDFRSSAR